MNVQFNHTIVHSRDKNVAAKFLTDILGLATPTPLGPFLAVHLDNGLTLDFYTDDLQVVRQHYAFLVSDSEFDAIYARIRQYALPFWADPFHRRATEINTENGGRGVYFEDPSGHNLEIITRT